MSNDLERAVQWYPGHMVTAMRKIGEYLKLTDVVIEVVDARVPHSGRNPMLDTLIGTRKRLLVLNREDLADPDATQSWIRYFENHGLPAVSADGRAQPSVKRAGALILELAGELRKAERGITRAIIVGLPNGGKSSIINGLLRRAAAKTEDKAGVTRQLRWFRMDEHVELLDSPGILVPKIATPDAQWKLALAGAVPRDRYDPEEIVHKFAAWYAIQRSRAQPGSISAPNPGHMPVPTLNEFAETRGFVRKGGEIDYHNAGQSYIRAFNEGTFGRITLELPGDTP